MKLLDALQWRYATKKMNGQNVPDEKVECILDAIRLSPSAFGLQPYHIIVVTDPELKKQILPIANNQQQIINSSHLLIFAAWDKITDERINEFIELNAKTRNVTTESLAQIKTYMNNIKLRSDEVNFNWAARQAYIAFGIGLSAAALEEVDSTPMEGFNSLALDTLLGLEKQGLKSVTLMPLGYRDSVNDWLLPLAKVRKEKNKLFIRK